jgi:hypothetical protein
MCRGVGLQKVFTLRATGAKLLAHSGRVAELADAKDLGSFGAILAGSTPVAPTNPVPSCDSRLARPTVQPAPVSRRLQSPPF